MKRNFSIIIVSIFVALLGGIVLSYAAPSKHLVSSPPRGIRIQQTENSLLITWKPPLRSVDGYRIYRSNFKKILGEMITTINNPNATSFVDSSVQQNIKYYYTVRSFFVKGLESTNKIQVFKIVKIPRKAVATPPAQQLSTCSADVWSCGDWSPCWAIGQQVRTCSLAFDCSVTAQPERPIETQSCTPPAQSHPAVSNPNDLGELYKQKPSRADIDQIMNDFNLNWVNDSIPGEIETWPNDFLFDQSSTKPSKMVIISRLNVLKHQSFSEPLPFTDLAIYDYVRKYAKNINIHVGCNYSDNSSFLNLGFGEGRWWSRESGTCGLTQYFAPYISVLQVFVHEARHSEPGDPKHTSCGITSGNDQYFENGSGFAYATMYLMWAYKYGTNDPPAIKEQAKNDAANLLQTRFCTKPTHSNSKVQAIIDELSK